MEVVSSTLNDQEHRNLNFTVDGEYLAIVQFIYDLENDSDLNFIAENFNMTSKHATFIVKDVKIQIEQGTVSNVSSTKTDTATNSENDSATDENESSENNENSEDTTSSEE